MTYPHCSSRFFHNLEKLLGTLDDQAQDWYSVIGSYESTDGRHRTPFNLHSYEFCKLREPNWLGYVSGIAKDE